MASSALQTFLCLPLRLSNQFLEVYLQWTQDHGVTFIKDHALPHLLGQALIALGFIACFVSLTSAALPERLPDFLTAQDFGPDAGRLHVHAELLYLRFVD